MSALHQVENALRTLYLSVISEQLNNAHPFFASIKQTTENVWGKDIKVAPLRRDTMLTQLLANVVGNITISDKALRAVSCGALVNLINAEMEAMLSATKNELSQLLFNGSKHFVGLTQLFGDADIYGCDRILAPQQFLTPAVHKLDGPLTYMKLQELVDVQDTNFILCDFATKRAYQQALLDDKQNIDVLTIAGGYKALSFNGIPLVADRNCPKSTMYLLNTNDFKLHQLCDWSWLAKETGSILAQVPEKAEYTATLVKYCNLICENPSNQMMITDIECN